jgi:hypothetical protein
MKHETIDVSNLKRRLERYKNMCKELRNEYIGKEEKYTFHAGHRLGYVEGKISEIENVLDILDPTFEQCDETQTSNKDFCLVGSGTGGFSVFTKYCDYTKTTGNPYKLTLDAWIALGQPSRI